MPELCAFAVSKPADACGQSLKFDSLARQINPAAQDAIIRKQLQNEVIGHSDVRRLARKRDPAKRPAPFAEQRPDVSGDESRKIVGILYAVLEGKCANVISIIKCDRTHFLQPQHTFYMPRDRIERLFFIRFRVTLAYFKRLFKSHPIAHVS